MMPAWGAVMGSAMYLKPLRPFHYFDVSAKAVISRGEEVLLLRRPNGRWDLPGGKARQGEHVTDALLREVREETGLTIGGLDRLSVVHRKRTNGRDCLVVSYHCTTVHPAAGKAIELSCEHEDFAFFRFEHTGGLRLRTHHKQAINAAWQHVCLAQAA